VNMMSEVR